MSNSHQHVRERERLDFAKIQGTIQIPNLIEVQMKSYQRFLQMDLLPSERDDGGLQSVFTSVFPIKDFREMSQLEFVDYSIGNWECKCGNLKGLHHLRATCRNCGASVVTNPYQTGDVICHKCGTFNKNTPTFCNKCGDPVAMQLKYDVNECQERGMTYSAPLKVTIRLTIYDKDPDTGAKTIRDIKEQEVFYGDIPLMTENGTFIINGTERVIVSQLHRSPGVFFESANNRSYFLGKIIPYRGSWVEFEYDTKNILYVRIDRKRKFLGSIFLRALGMKSNEEILRTFYQVERISLRDKDLFWNVSPGIVDRKLAHEIRNPRSEEVIVGAHKRITENLFKELIKAKISQVRAALVDLEGAYSVADVVNRQTGEVLLEANKPLTPELWQAFAEGGITEVDVFFPERDDIGLVLSRTLDKDAIRSSKEALIEIYRKLRPGDPPTLETATNLFRGMFFDPRKYDFSRVGRLKFNIKMGLDTPLDNRTLDTPDFVSAIKYLFKLRKNIGVVDDIDHLGNRRVRAVGELLENQFRIGLVRMERAIKEKMSVYQEMSTAMPHDLVNAKPVMAAIREFFGSSQLSQFMDQTNPLSEITHKRRLSALGPGGLSRERAGFEVRDVHPTHYGRICPIETPEGPNIGLISSLSCFARINDYGFIESPYRRVKGGRIIDYVQIVNAGDSEFKAGEIVEKDKVEELNEELKRRKVVYEPYCFYLSAWEEDKYVVAQANVSLDERLKITTELVNCRQAGNFVLKSRDEVDYVDVSPKQLVSVAASLIPFLENDDANRALMGSNMQRQAVPLIRGEAPLVGTGMERVTARDSGAVVLCKREGIVDQVDSERIIVRVESDHSGVLSREVGADIYQLIKFKRSNQNTCISQKPFVRVGDRVKKGQVLADGPCTERGELALGRNVLVAFVPWRGYNFEDAILVSEKLVKDDYYTSIHIEEYEIEARDTKLGPEEVTRDIPNISESFLRNLDESGVIRIGAVIKPGDILVGKVTPKGETTLTPEEKLLRAIFGEKAGDVRDASLYCPPGIEGTIVDVKIFTRKGGEKDERHKAIEATQVFKLEKNLADEIRILTDERLKRLSDLLGGKILQADLHDEKTNKRLLTKGVELDARPDRKDLHAQPQAPETQRKGSSPDRKDRRDRGDDFAPDRRPPQDHRGAQGKAQEGRRAASRRHQAGQGLYRHEAQALHRRQNGRTPRQQGRHRPHRAAGRYAMPSGWHARRDRSESARRSFAYERRTGSRNAPRLGRQGTGQQPQALAQQGSEGRSIRRWFREVFTETTIWKTLAKLSDDELLEYAEGFREGIPFATPVFDGAREPEIRHLLEVAGLPHAGKINLFDGMTGDQFDQPVTVGYIYMLKLSHLVDDKIHARSIGPYSLITQQPLGGKAQFGGQRFGEMEVWALEAYGAAHILQELLTAKSDDVYGRAKIYEAIVKGEPGIEPGVPESFNVLVRELQSLCLDVELMKRQKPPSEKAAD